METQGLSSNEIVSFPDIPRDLTLAELQRRFSERKLENPFSEECLGIKDPYSGTVIQSEADYDRCLRESVYAEYCKRASQAVEQCQALVKAYETRAVTAEAETKAIRVRAETLELQCREVEKKRRKPGFQIVAILLAVFFAISYFTRPDESALRSSGYSNGFTEGQAAGYEAGLSDGNSAGYEKGRSEGEAAGYEEGQKAGQSEGYDSGYDSGYEEGRSKGYDEGYADYKLKAAPMDYEAGHEAGYDAGFLSGHDAGYDEGFELGVSEGYSDGYSDGEAARAKRSSSSTRSQSGSESSTPRANPVANAYIGNANSKKFHRPTCSYLPNQENQVVFDTREAAIAAGYSPCGHCNP